MLKARFVREVGTRVYLRRYWGAGCGVLGCHNATSFLFDTKETLNGKDREGKITYHRYGGIAEDYPEEQWPAVCDHCGEACPADAARQVFNERLYNTTSGKPEPGDLYYTPWHDDVFWDNQTTPTLSAVCPNGSHWCIDGRASNCGSPADRLHRCWVRHGDPETGVVHVDKAGRTCSAGGGSIQAGDYHGFLHNGFFT